jgi:hypothetical protein
MEFICSSATYRGNKLVFSWNRCGSHEATGTEKANFLYIISKIVIIVIYLAFFVYTLVVSWKDHVWQLASEIGNTGVSTHS